MAPKQAGRTQYSISCPCGGYAISLDARGFGRPNVCRRCGGSFTVAWGKDAMGRSAPMAVQLARKRAATPLQVVCTCGYRRPVTPAEAAGHNRCPGCGKVMIVEKPPPPKNAAGARVTLNNPPPPLTPSRSGGSEPRLVKITPDARTIDCICGEKILIRNEMVGQMSVCPGCNRRIKVEMKEKDASGTFRPPVAGSRTPTPTPSSSNSGSFQKPELACECGQVLDIVNALGANGTVCKRCGRTVTMEKVRNPATKHTIIRPRFTPKGQSVSPPAPPPPPRSPAPAPAPEPMYEMPAVEFTEPVAAAPLPPPPAAASTQAVFCPCGEDLTVGSEDVGKNLQCPTCLTLMAVDQLRDPKSGNYVLRVRAIGKMDQDTWSLSDFA